ncbi:MAG TPA: sugar transferase [Balneolales bacterium]|nr:sugar transferase [Balneolales bacterium]
MERVKTIIVTAGLDFIALMLAWYVFYYARFHWGLFPGLSAARPATVLLPSIVIALFWIVVFLIFGLYRNLYLISRFDETVRVLKVVTIGTLILFFLLFIDSLGWNSGNIHYAKTYTLFYWFVNFIFVSLDRFIIRTFQRVQVQKGRGLHHAVIIGTGPTAISVYENIQRHRVSGLNVLGFVKANSAKDGISGLPLKVIGSVEDLKKVIINREIQEIIVALEPHQSDSIIEIVDRIDIPNVSVKILPDFYQMIIGLNQTNQIFGLPLIEVMPDPMPSWEKFAKDVMDIAISLFILSITLPITLLITLLIKLTSRGPVIYRQRRVGLYGKEFYIYKFRTMYNDAEKHTGPVWASKDDPRITPVGNWLRKLRLDEIPQFFNVIKGDMSLVGPRPERPFFVNEFKKRIPLYTRRLRVKPGITGWAQVKWKYDSNIEDVREKTKYDLFYVENMSLSMDLKILINTLITILTGRGQ